MEELEDILLRILQRLSLNQGVAGMVKKVFGALLLLLSLIGASNAKPSTYVQPRNNWFVTSHSQPVIHRSHHWTRHHSKARVPVRHRHHMVSTWKRHIPNILRAHSDGGRVAPTSQGIVTVDSAAGPITVAKDFVQPILGFIEDVVKEGFEGPVHCYARSGHVPNSNHHTGHACDFAQRGWGKTAPIMYHVSDIAQKWGLRDGCSFRRSDCGHIDNGQNIGWHRPAAVARTLKGYMQEHNL